MGRKPRVDRSPEEKWQIVQEGIKSGNVSETCRRHGIAPNLFYRWKDEAEQGAKAALEMAVVLVVDKWFVLFQNDTVANDWSFVPANHFSTFSRITGLMKGSR
jgi:transposase-like protein